MTDLKSLDSQTRVAAQLWPDDVAEFSSQGVALIINNRPDGEEPGQPDAAMMADVATEAGLEYLYAPIRGLPDDSNLDTIESALAGLGPDQRAVMHCRSGLRSAVAWGLVRARSGALTRDEIISAGAAAGYDLSRLPL